ncbi:hypothetical protein BRD00_09645 [Halobacteriales archaeon QS_8_69_26]|nr:MAG: hypothetical protein BRD00_09645 [Halobacteriales archaeon QS_8_69_26]
MEETPSGTPVGVDDPYEHAGRCDHLTDDGRCRFAIERAGDHPKFAADIREREYACPAADPEDEWEWRDCPHYRSRQRSRECVRCGLEERRVAHRDERPLLEEHHLSYADGSGTAHEITVYLCRWCHARVHDSWARVTDDVEPPPEAIAEREARRSRELEEAGFETAADRFGDEVVEDGNSE